MIGTAERKRKGTVRYFLTVPYITGGRGGIRTRDPWLRRPVLYPAELPALIS